jgi:TldD protein
MKVPPSTYLTEMKESLKHVVQILSRDFSYVSLLSTDSIGMRFSVRKRAIDVRQSNWCERGSVIRVYDGHRYFEYSFNNLKGDSREDIGSLAAEICQRFQRDAATVKELPFNFPELPSISETPLSGSWQGEVGILADTVSTEETTRRLSRIKDRAFDSSKHLVEIEVRFEHMRVSKLQRSGTDR